MGESNKSLPPTEKKLEDARKEGNFLHSQDVVQAVTLLALLGAAMVAVTMIPVAFNDGLTVMLRYVAHPNLESVFINNALADFLNIFVAKTVLISSVFIGSFVITSILANIAQVGFVFSGAKITKGLEFETGLNFVANAKQMFSKRSLVTLLLGVVKVIIICYISYYVIISDKTLGAQVLACRFDALCALEIGAWRVMKILLYIAFALVPLAAIDWFVQYKIYMKENMMSHDDMQREHKESEGDPHMKGHRQQFAREIVEGDFARVANASAIVRNPTHVAIALRYEPQTMALPYVIAVGVDDKALQIIAQAEKHGIPSYINIPLARAMVDKCEPNKHVPLEYMDQMIKFSSWLGIHHPERVYDKPEIAGVGKGGNLYVGRR